MERVAHHLEMEKIRVSGSATASYIASNKEQSKGVQFFIPLHIVDRVLKSKNDTEPFIQHKTKTLIPIMYQNLFSFQMTTSDMLTAWSLII